MKIKIINKICNLEKKIELLKEKILKVQIKKLEKIKYENLKKIDFLNINFSILKKKKFIRRKKKI